MKAVLIGAGHGTRLGRLTEAIPKLLVDVRGKTVLDWQLEYLRQRGVDEVLLNVHAHAAQVFAAAHARRGVSPALTLYPEAELLGTAGALLPMRQELREGFLILYADVLTDFPLPNRSPHAPAIVSLVCQWTYSTAGKGEVVIDGKGGFRFAEKAGSHPGIVWTGLAYAQPALLDYIEPGDDFGYDVWPRLCRANLLSITQSAARFVDVGTPEGLLAW